MYKRLLSPIHRFRKSENDRFWSADAYVETFPLHVTATVTVTLGT